jgi:succinate dehydrogenase/fumarate reductase flavoprotein subunit
MAKIAVRFALDKRKLGRGSRLTMGNALAGRLLHSVIDAGVDLYEATPVEGLVCADGKVTAVRATVKGVSTEITANKGVILASGGFSGNAEMRKAYIPFAEQHVSILPYENTGDGISSAQAAGAAMGGQSSPNGHAKTAMSNAMPI